MKHFILALATLSTVCLSLSACSDSEPAPIHAVKLAPIGSVMGVDHKVIRINLVNYLGNSENIHPKVLYFDRGWNGHKWWMAYTPYPHGSIADENPCIAVSDDGINWAAPEGLENPLATAPRGGYQSDTHLVYEPVHDVLECWYRTYNIKENSSILYSRTSTDGVHWTEAENVSNAVNSVHKDCLSPAVSVVDGHYLMAYMYWGGLFTVRAQSPVPAVDWGTPREIKIPYPKAGMSIWHQDMVVDEETRTALVAANCPEAGHNNNSADLYLFSFNIDTGEATVPELLIARGTDPDDIDYKAVYRSSIVLMPEQMLVYFSSIDRSDRRHMSLAVFPR